MRAPTRYARNLRPGELRPAADYDACLADADPYNRLDCMRQTLASQTAICDAGWNVESI